MNVSVVQIGNSKGIRLSKTLIEKYNIKDTLEMILESGYIILKPKSRMLNLLDLEEQLKIKKILKSRP